MAPAPTRSSKRSTSRPGSATASRSSSRAGRRRGGARRAPLRRRPDQPRQRHRRAARNDRRDRAGHGRRHPRVPRPARRPLLGRPARPGQRDRAGDDGGAARPSAALSGEALPRAIASPSRRPSPWRSPTPARSASGPTRPSAGGCRRARRSWPAASCSATTRASTPRPSRTSAAPGSATCSRSAGQNVALLALLAMPVLALLGLPLRARLALGARPDRRLRAAGRSRALDPAGRGDGSAERAGDAGGRRASRLYALAVAAARHPRDRPRHRRRRRLAAELRRRARHPLPGGADGGRDRRPRSALRGARSAAPWPRATAMTVAATPGDGAADRLPFRRTLDRHPGRQPPRAAGGRARRCGWGCWPPPAARYRASRSRRSTLPGSLLLGYIAQVASWCARPGWACVEVGLGPGGLVGSYAAIAAAAPSSPGAARPLAASVAGVAWSPPAGARGRRRSSPAAPRRRRRRGGPARPAGLRVTVLDVGQGDAILLQPAAAPRDPGRRRAARRRAGREAGRGRGRRARRRRRHPRPVRPRRRASRSCSARMPVGTLALRGRRPRPAGARRGRRARGRGGSPPAASCAPAGCASTSLWPPPRAARRAPRRRGPQPPGAGHRRPLGRASRCC